MLSLAKLAYINCTDAERDRFNDLNTPRINIDTCCIGIFQFIRRGHLMLFLEEGGEVDESYNEQLKVTAIELAASLGHLNCLQLALRLGFPRTSKVCLYAATYGNLECLQYAHENGCEWNALVCEKAATHGHLECLKYARENGCPWNEKVLAGATTYGHLDCLEYATKKGCPLDLETVGVRALIRNRQSSVIHRDEHGIATNLTYCEIALRTGNMTVLRWLLDNRYHVRRSLCWKAAFLGNLEGLQMLHGFGVPWDEKTCAVAAARGHLECLQYAHRNGCPWDSRTSEMAASHRHVECLVYARLNGCPPSTAGTRRHRYL